MILLMVRNLHIRLLRYVRGCLGASRVWSRERSEREFGTCGRLGDRLARIHWGRGSSCLPQQIYL